MYICIIKQERPGVFPENRERNNMNTQSIYNGLDYTTKEINRNFKIKVNGIVNGKKVNVLVGVSGLTDTRNLRRGWGRCCCKSCAAQLREKNKPGYNPERVAVNNARRKFWADCPEPEHYPLSYDGADFDQWGDCEFGIHD